MVYQNQKHFNQGPCARARGHRQGMLFSALLPTSFAADGMCAIDPKVHDGKMHLTPRNYARASTSGSLWSETKRERERERERGEVGAGEKNRQFRLYFR